MPMRTISLLSTIILALLFATPAFACECENEGVKSSDMKAAAAKYDVIFVGRAKEVTTSAFKPKEFGIRFAIMQKLKGLEDIPLKNVLVYTPRLTGDCGIEFTIGHDYLIFANGSLAYMHTNSCSETNMLEASKLNVERLNRVLDSEK